MDQVVDKSDLYGIIILTRIIILIIVVFFIPVYPAHDLRLSVGHLIVGQLKEGVGAAICRVVNHLVAKQLDLEILIVSLGIQLDLDIIVAPLEE